MGNNVIDYSGAEVDLKTYSKRLVGLYFANGSTQQCKNFNKSLNEFYKRHARKFSFEVVFISNDRNHEQFSQFYADMEKWLAFSYEKKEERVS